MNQPLGQAVGNSLEVIEAIHALQGDGPEQFVKHCRKIASYMLMLGGIANDEETAARKFDDVIENGKALDLFENLVRAQGGDIAYVKNVNHFPKAPFIKTVISPESGYLSEINARIVGETAVKLGAGRERKSDDIDHSVGIEIYHNVGDHVSEGQPLFTIHAKNEADFFAAKELLLKAHRWSRDPVAPLPLFYGVIRN
jgi:pyrimidine-nucleoside phosphorylase